MLKTFLPFFVLILSACSLQPPVNSLDEIPIPADLIPAREFDLQQNTHYETFAKQIALSMFLVWDIPVKKTHMGFFIVDYNVKTEEQHYNFYRTELDKQDWVFDPEVLNFHRWRHQSRRGTQTFLTSYARIPNSSKVLVIRLLYPVY